MIFSSIDFIVFFAILALLLLVIRGDRGRQLLLLTGSYVFYGWWDWRFLSLILASSLWSFAFGLAMNRTRDDTRRRIYLILSLCCDLGLLAWFKYANFFLDSFASLFGLTDLGVLQITLPVGISFFTFQTMSYSIDLYRRQIQVCNDPVRFMLFVSFFPQLVAGPIVRASEFLPQLYRRVTTDWAQISLGLQIFLCGLAQKVLVADNVAALVDPVFAHPDAYDTATLWLGLAAYSLQIFCDFSGYSLMAIGVARVLGFELPENFRTPYLAQSITDFWRRWHMSLSRWLRDYLYISLGGNRKGPIRTDVNLILTMLLGGLWHGAGWNFVIWGAFHGIGLLAHKRWRAKVDTSDLKGPIGAIYPTLAWGITLLYACLLWVPFRCIDFHTTQLYLAGLFTAQAGIHWMHTQTVILVGVMAIWHALHTFPNPVLKLVPSEQPFRWAPLLSIGLLVLLVLMFAPLEASPFIYFQF